MTSTAAAAVDAATAAAETIATSVAERFTAAA
jgi:hypothetical protein